MFAIIKSFRIPDCLLLVALASVAFKYAGTEIIISQLIGLFLVTTSTMLQNDWRDRHHDINKGKRIAVDKPGVFLSLVIVFWIISILAIAFIFQQNNLAGGLLGIMAIVGVFYSEARKVPLLSVILVTVTVASSTLLPLASGVEFIKILPLFISVMLIMFGRETLHDIADYEAEKIIKKQFQLFLEINLRELPQL